MTRSEKVRLSLSFDAGHAFRQGLFMRLYEASLYWFTLHVRPLKIMLETTREGERLLYGGLPIASFEALLREDALPEAHSTEYGYCWYNAGESVEQSYPAWRQAHCDRMPEPVKKRAAMPQHDIIAGIQSFELSRATPMQAMNAIAAWQELLRGPGKEGA